MNVPSWGPNGEFRPGDDPGASFDFDNYVVQTDHSQPSEGTPTASDPSWEDVPATPADPVARGEVCEQETRSGQSSAMRPLGHSEPAWPPLPQIYPLQPQPLWKIKPEETKTPKRRNKKQKETWNSYHYKGM